MLYRIIGRHFLMYHGENNLLILKNTGISYVLVFSWYRITISNWMIDRSEFIKSARLQFDDALTIIKKYCSYCRSFLLGTGNSKTVMKIHSHLSL